MILRVLALAVAATLLAPASAVAESGGRELPPVGTHWDYQLGGARTVPASVGIVVRDRQASPAAGRYNICYVNGFQTQSHERSFWRKRWDLVLKRNGQPVVDEAWGEWILDIRTAAKRKRLVAVMDRWIAGCATRGYDGLELDNLDSFTRSHGLITASQARAFARLLTYRAHRHGLAVAQKNWAGLDGRRLGFDFAIAESCGHWRECHAYARFYGRRVLAVEYSMADFRRTCAGWGDRLPVVLRNTGLGSGTRRWC